MQLKMSVVSRVTTKVACKFTLCCIETELSGGVEVLSPSSLSVLLVVRACVDELSFVRF